MSTPRAGRLQEVTEVVTLRGPLSAGAIEIACEHVAGLLLRGQHVVIALEHCDLSVVDAVSRMRLLAKRHGGRLDVTGDRTVLAACGLAP